MKRKPLYERAEKVAQDLALDVVLFMHRLEDKREGPMTTSDLTDWLKTAYLRGYDAGRRDERRRQG